MEPERVWRLRKHLVQSLRAMRTMKRPVESASPLRPEPEGFIGKVARAACSLCRGFCCKGGGDHGYLDERVMARVRQAQPELDARAVMRLYVERVPAAGYAGSCMFHGRQAARWTARCDPMCATAISAPAWATSCETARPGPASSSSRSTRRKRASRR